MSSQRRLVQPSDGPPCGRLGDISHAREFSPSSRNGREGERGWGDALPTGGDGVPSVLRGPSVRIPLAGQRWVLGQSPVQNPDIHRQFKDGLV